MGYNDFFEKIVRQGNTGKSGLLTRSNVSKTRSTGVENYTSFENSAIDQEWAERYDNSKSPNTYFDYFYAGQDIKVTIDGVEDDYARIPIVNFGFSVEQQKTPVYGLWSFTYDGVMRGTRIVSGTFTVATTRTDYMRGLLQRAATTRANVGVSPEPFTGRPLTEDDTNINMYWGKNLDPYLGESGKNIFSVHPPFTFVVLYGLQDMSVSPENWSNSTFDSLYEDNPVSLDTNERLTDANPLNNSSRFIIEAVELQSFQTGYSTDGSVVSETYQFFARDLVIPPRK